MYVKKERIKFNGDDMNLKISIGSNLEQVGQQQSINDLAKSTGESLINPIIDGEVRRFRYSVEDGGITMKFYFYLINYQNAFETAGFTTNEIMTGDLNVLNSFFIMDFYDTFDTYTQTKFFTTYLTKIGTLPNYLIDYSSDYDFNQLYYWNIPLSYLNKYTGDTITGYVKFSFFNSKTGKISLFYNKDNDDDIVIRKTPEKMYFKTVLDLVNQTWLIDTPSFNNNYEMLAYELLPSTYVNRVNNTMNSFENKQQIYPSGNTFISKFGNYSIK